jgi:uncharacterized membrane protein (UPF0127 family)
MRYRVLFWAAAAVALLLTAEAAWGTPRFVELVVNGHALAAEVADTEAERERGLMYRRMLPENRGMLFVFPRSERHGMWMMNTYIPLSVAFLDADGVIINIAEMEPHTRDVHAAARPARYALEMNQGWFAAHGIKAGAKVTGLATAGPAR